MLFSRSDARATGYAVASTAAVAVLSQLRRAYPLLTDIPQFTPSAASGTATAPRDWLGDFPRSLARQALLAIAFAATVLGLAMTLPAWAGFHNSGSSTAPRSELRSSAGTTSTVAARIPDINASAFVGDVPFVEHIRYFASLTSSAPAAATFVQGAREASIVNYLQGVGRDMALPYLSNAVASRQQIDTFAAAVQETQRQAQIEAARQASARAVASRAWETAPVAGGGTELSSTVTFYACVGNGFCGNMASGQQAFQGAAACSADLPLGTRFVVDADPNRTVFTCLDRGALSPTWVDIWFYDAADGWSWQANVGTSSEITLVQ